MTIKSFYTSLSNYPSINLAQTMFATTVRMMENHPNYSRVAWYKGKNGTGLTGNKKQPGASGENAWAVYRALDTSDGVPPFDVVFTWSSDFSANQEGNGQWANIGDAGGDGFCVAIATHPSGIAWNGSSGSVGNDDFLTGTLQPWKTGSYILPRVNGVGGTLETTRNGVSSNILQNIQSANPESIGVFVGSADNNGIVIGWGGVGQYGLSTLFYAGGYSRLTSSIQYPICMINILDMTSYNGGVCGYVSASSKSGVMTYPHHTSGFPSIFSNYDAYFNGESRNIITEHSPLVGASDTGYDKFLGRIAMFNSVSPNAVNLVFYNNNTRLIIGYQNLPGPLRFSIPFDPETKLESYV